MEKEEEKTGLGLEEAIVRAVSTTMEALAFEQAILEDEPEESESVPYWSCLPLLEPYEGKLVLWLSEACVSKLLDSIHGPGDDLFSDEEKEIDEVMLFDTLAELINTMAGRFLDLLLPSDLMFELGLPETGKGGGPDLSSQQRSWYFSIEEEYIKVTIAGEELLKHS